MDTIQTDVSDQALVTAIRANLCDVFRHMSRSDPVNHFENERFVRWYTSLEHPWFNGVLCTDLPTDDAESFIEETIKYFHKKQVAVFTWWLEPHLKRSDWESVLSKYGFGFSDDTPGMAIVLSELNESMAKRQGLEIRVVEDENAMHTWVNIFVKGYGLPLDWEDQIFETWMKLGFDFPMHNYLGYLNGEPVSTSCLFLGGGADFDPFARSARDEISSRRSAVFRNGIQRLQKAWIQTSMPD